MTVVVTSQSHLSTLTVPQSTLNRDRLLTLIAGLSPPLQVKTVVTGGGGGGGGGKKKGSDGGGKGGGGKKNKKDSSSSAPAPAAAAAAAAASSSSLRLELFDGTTVLTRRNTILRTLCTSPASPLDSAPYNLLGGFTVDNASSTASRAGLAAVNSWMSYASSLSDHVGDDGGGGLGGALGDLDAYLADRSFLIHTGGVSLADLAVYHALVDHCTATATRGGGSSMEDLEAALGGLPNASRWFDAVQYQASAWMGHVRSSSNAAWPSKLSGELDAPQVNVRNAVAPPPPPVFFYGHEEGLESLLTSGGGAAAPRGPATAAKKGGPQQAPPAKSGGGGGGGGGAGGEGPTEEQKRAAIEKRAKKAAEKAAKQKKNQQVGGGGGGKGGKGDAGGGGGGELDISALDIRVGRIVKAWEHPDAEKLYCEEVDVGPDAGGVRKIASGLRPFYTLDEMQNRLVLVLCNLKARNLVGFPSHGMVLCASNDDRTEVVFAVPPEGAEVGERVVFDGPHAGKEPEPENRVAKKKMFEKLAPDLVTDGEGGVEWRGSRAMTSAGQCRAVNGMPKAHVS